MLPAVNENAPAAVLSPLDDHMGLDIARTLGRRGIPVYGIDPNSRVAGACSKYCHYRRCPPLEKEGGTAFLEYMKEFGKSFEEKPVLFPLSDDYVLFVSEHRSALQELYAFVMPEHNLLVSLATKDGLQQVAEDRQIPAPRTIFLNQEHPLETTAQKLEFPVILKPAESTYWHTPQISRLLRKGMLAARAKVILCRNVDELTAAYRQISRLEDRLVVQEVVPGEDSRLAYFSFYFNRQSEPLGTFAGRKHRVLPVGFGSASFVRSMHDRELEEAAFRILDGVRYCGLGGIEFKKDPRDEKYKLIEFNTRYGMWDGLGTMCGVDLAYIAYCDALHLPVGNLPEYQDDVIWVDWQRDARAALEYIKAGKLTFPEWMRSYRGRKMWAVYARDDWRPGVAYSLSLLQKFWDRVWQN